jgi:hypothetical protein
MYVKIGKKNYVVHQGKEDKWFYVKAGKRVYTRAKVHSGNKPKASPKKKKSPKRKSPKRKSPKRKSPKRKSKKKSPKKKSRRPKKVPCKRGKVWVPARGCRVKCKKGQVRDRVTKRCRADKRNSRKRSKKRSPKRKSPKRKSPKRKSPKRKSPKKKRDVYEKKN